MRASSTSCRFPTITRSTLFSTASRMPFARAIASSPAALLELPPAPAGARVVPSHLPARAHRLPAIGLVPVGGHRQRSPRGLAHQRDMEDRVRHVVADIGEEAV